MRVIRPKYIDRIINPANYRNRVGYQSNRRSIENDNIKGCFHFI